METETKGDFNLQTKATKKELVKSLENALVNLEKELKLLQFCLMQGDITFQFKAIIFILCGRIIYSIELLEYQTEWVYKLCNLFDGKWL